MKFFVDMIPPTKTAQQQKYAVVKGRCFVYKPKELKTAQEMLTMRFKPYRPKKPYTCGVRLLVRWQFPRGRRRPGYRITRPDTDNLQKMLKDVMTKVGFWKDDALVAVEHVEKLWSDRPGIYVEIEGLEESESDQNI